MKHDLYQALTQSLAEERLVAQATVVEGPGTGRQMLLWPDGRRLGGLGSDEPEAAVEERLAAGLLDLVAGRLQVETSAGAIGVFLEVHQPRPKLVLVGAVHVAIPLITMARAAGLRTVVIDPRGTFATGERFALADELIREWPQEALAAMPLNESTYVATLSHDPKIDLPAVAAVLRSPVRYIGALGSKKTHAKRVAALRDQGFTEEEIGRIHAPIGLDLGGRRPQEIAVAILAQIVAVTHGRRGAARG